MLPEQGIPLTPSLLPEPSSFQHVLSLPFTNNWIDYVPLFFVCMKFGDLKSSTHLPLDESDIQLFCDVDESAFETSSYSFMHSLECVTRHSECIAVLIFREHPNLPCRHLLSPHTHTSCRHGNSCSLVFESGRVKLHKAAFQAVSRVHGM